jgi:type I restriction enzyme, S subunit
MKPYPKYKDSGLEWIGEIPEHWEVKKFKYLFVLITEKNDVKLKKIGLENIECETGKFIDTKTNFEGEGIHFKTNDILFGKLRPYLAKVYLAKFEGKAVGDFYVFRCKNEITERYAFNLILSKPYIEVINGSTFGSKMPRASWDFIANLKNAYPEIEEQTAIADYLDRKIAKIDDLIARKECLLELYEEEKTAIINQSVTKGINPDVKLKDSGIDWLGEIPEEWEVKKLKYIAKIKTGYTPPKNDSNNYSDDGKIWVKPDNLKQLVPIVSSSKKISNQGLKENSIIPKGSVLVCCIGSIGKLGIAGVNLITNQQINAIVFNSYVNSQFGQYLIISSKEEHIKYANENVVKILTTKDQGQIVFAIPSLHEQAVIANHLDCKTAEIDAKVAKTKKMIELLKEYRAALISEVVTGKINVTQESGS